MKTPLATNTSNNKTLPTILSFTFIMIFETYIFKYFKVRIADSHSLASSCASLVYVPLFFISDGEYCIQQTFSK